MRCRGAGSRYRGSRGGRSKPRRAGRTARARGRADEGSDLSPLRGWARRAGGAGGSRPRLTSFAPAGLYLFRRSGAGAHGDKLHWKGADCMVKWRVFDGERSSVGQSTRLWSLGSRVRAPSLTLSESRFSVGYTHLARCGYAGSIRGRRSRLAWPTEAGYRRFLGLTLPTDHIEEA